MVRSLVVFGFLFFLAFSCVTEVAVAGSMPASYFSNLPDIPMMEGMIELPDEGFVFDAPEGQVARTAVFAPKRMESEILGYYAKALPELGWTARKAGLFMRNGEQLTVTIGKVEGGSSVLFDLVPESD